MNVIKLYEEVNIITKGESRQAMHLAALMLTKRR